MRPLGDENNQSGHEYGLKWIRVWKVAFGTNNERREDRSNGRGGGGLPSADKQTVGWMVRFKGSASRVGKEKYKMIGLEVGRGEY